MEECQIEFEPSSFLGTGLSVGVFYRAVDNQSKDADHQSKLLNPASGIHNPGSLIQHPLFCPLVFEKSVASLPESCGHNGL